MSPPRQTAVVLRIYQPTPDATARAVEMLLRCDQGIKKAAHPGGPDDAKERKERFENDSRAKSIIPK